MTINRSLKSNESTNGASKGETMTDTRNLITTVEVAELLRYSPKTIYKKAAKGEIPSIPISRRKRLFSRQAIEYWLANRQMGDL
jgi:excisionase family DNA binding protein